MGRPKARRPLPVPGPGEEHSCCMAAFADRTQLSLAGVDEARVMTHDALLEQLGDRRRSGVWWQEFRGAQALEAYRQLCAGEPEPQFLEALTGNPRALLIVAFAISAKEDPSS